MTQLVRDYLEIREVASLDELIARLQTIRDTLPHGAEPVVRLCGDDHFGRHIAVVYRRPLTHDEAGLEARYRHADPLRLDAAA